MGYSQVVLGLYQGSDLTIGLPANASSFGHLLAENGFPASFTTVQKALLIAPPAVLLLFYPLRLFQLRQENLKVLPNRTGAFKAVSHSVGVRAKDLLNDHW